MLGYPNHYQMKLARIEKFKQAKGLCEICKKTANVIHHIDESKSNHELKNIIIVCSHCHAVLHTKDNPKLKIVNSITVSRTKYLSFKKIYGFTYMDLKKKFGLTHYEIYKFHKKGTLQKYIQINKGKLNA